MVTKTFNIPLDLKQPSAAYDVEVAEGDNGNTFVITLTDDGDAVDLTGCRVLAVFSRPDGETVEQDTDDHGVSVGGDCNNVVTIDLYASSFSYGGVACELQVYSGENQATLVTSAQFNFECRRTIMNEDTIRSEVKYPILVSLISQVTALAATITSAIADAVQRVQANWMQSDNSKTDYIKNKPSTFAPSAHASSHGSSGTDAVTPAAIGAATPASALTATLAAADWVELAQTVSVAGVTAAGNVVVSAAPASIAAWREAGVYCSAQGDGTLTFACVETPAGALTANVLILA